MSRRKLSTVLLCLGALGAMPSQATLYSSFLENGVWQAKTTQFECQLVHAVPMYGQAVFETRAGEALRFYLEGESHRLQSTQALLLARSPVWAEQYRQADLGEVLIQPKAKAVTLMTDISEKMLMYLLSGLELELRSNQAYEQSSQNVRLAITPIGFRGAYERYSACLSGLLPVNFEQIKRTAVYFDQGGFESLKASEVRKLDNIAAYFKADASVKEFFIDGHTDSSGSRTNNLELSQRRAEEVMQYLVSRGVPKESIVSRWHGERYPIASNDTPAGRAQNRRVTIRLERSD